MPGKEERKGLVVVITGDGKGKTSAALGMALRALGHGFRVKMIQFMKGVDNVYGELRASRNLPGFEIEQHGRSSFVNRRSPAPEDVQMAQAGLARAKEVVCSGEWDMVILDEINVAVDYGLVSEEQVLELIRGKPRWVDLVLTGRNASSKVIEVSDLVSEVREVKHHYRSGIPAREGMEY